MWIGSCIVIWLKRGLHGGFGRHWNGRLGLNEIVRCFGKLFW